MTYDSSAKDALLKKTVAVKKLAEPFGNAIISKHIFREIKLLNQLRHDNVGRLEIQIGDSDWLTLAWQIISLNDIFISPSEDMSDIMFD